MEACVDEKMNCFVALKVAVMVIREGQ